MRVLLFAQVREIVGSDHINISHDLPTITPSQIALRVAQAVGADQSLQTLLERCMIAIDHEYAMELDAEYQVSESTEVAIIPPVSGG